MRVYPVANVCNFYSASQPGTPQDIIRATAWTSNAVGSPFAIIRRLFRFNQIELIPSCASIHSASLQLYNPAPNRTYYPGSSLNSYGSNDVLIRRVTQPWNVASVIWNTHPS